MGRLTDQDLNFETREPCMGRCAFQVVPEALDIHRNIAYDNKVSIRPGKVAYADGAYLQNL